VNYFSFIPETKKWANDGRNGLKEVASGFMMMLPSIWYELSSVITQLFSFGISLTELYNKPFSEPFYKIHKD
jgi:hypothetical protein